jgi:hypothetical protein
MYALFILCTDSSRRYHTVQFWSRTIESGFDALTQIISQGWQLRHIRCLDLEDEYGNWIDLPPEAFDEQPMADTLEDLQKEWKQLLAHPA